MAPSNKTLDFQLQNLINLGKKKQKSKKRQYSELIDDVLRDIDVSDAKFHLREGFLVPGDQITYDLRAAIRKFPRCTAQQLLFTEVFWASQCPFIYGNDFEVHETRIKQENNTDEFYQYALVCCPRRWGKTYITSIYCACTLLTVPDSKIVLYSPGKRQSQMIMDLVRDHLTYLRDTHGYLYETVMGKDNQENLHIIVDGNRRSIVGLPAKAETVRGTGGTLIICEEAAVMPLKFISNVVFPVTAVGLASCICISTIQGDSMEGEQNWFTTLLDMCYPDGRPMFNTFKLYQACKACIDAGQAEKCEHLKDELPWWHKQSKQMLVRDMMEKLGQGESVKRELLGVNTSQVKTIYQSTHVRHLFSLEKNPLVEPYQITEDPALIFVAIDPSGGGPKSNVSLVSMIFYGNQYIILGGESIPAKLSHEALPYINQHIRQLRDLPKMSHATIIVAIENNIGQSCKEIGNSIISMNLPRVKFLYKNARTVDSAELYKGGGVRDGTFGVRTQGRQGSGNVKEDMVFTLRQHLHNHSLKFYRHFNMAYRPENVPDPIKDYKSSLMIQMLAYSRKLKLAEGEFAMTKYTYSAKHCSVGHDDDCTVCSICLHWFNYYLTHHEIADI
jgi:hypothetical protein